MPANNIELDEQQLEIISKLDSFSFGWFRKNIEVDPQILGVNDTWIRAYATVSALLKTLSVRFDKKTSFILTKFKEELLKPYMRQLDEVKLLAKIFSANDSAATLLQDELGHSNNYYNTPIISRKSEQKLYWQQRGLVVKLNEVYANNNIIDRRILEFTSPTAQPANSMFQFNDSFVINRTATNVEDNKFSFLLQYVTEIHNDNIISSGSRLDALKNLVRSGAITLNPVNAPVDGSFDIATFPNPTFNKQEAANAVWGSINKEQKIDFLKLTYQTRIDSIIKTKANILLKSVTLARFMKEIEDDKKELESFFTFRKSTKERLRNRIKENENKIIQLAETTANSAVLRGRNINNFTEEERRAVVEQAKYRISASVNTSINVLTGYLIDNPGVRVGELLEKETDPDVIAYFKALDQSMSIVAKDCKTDLLENQEFAGKVQSTRLLSRIGNEDTFIDLEPMMRTELTNAAKHRTPFFASGLYPPRSVVKKSISYAVFRREEEIVQNVKEPILTIIRGEPSYIPNVEENQNEQQIQMQSHA